MKKTGDDVIFADIAPGDVGSLVEQAEQAIETLGRVLRDLAAQWGDLLRRQALERQAVLDGTAPGTDPAGRLAELEARQAGQRLELDLERDRQAEQLRRWRRLLQTLQAIQRVDLLLSELRERLVALEGMRRLNEAATRSAIDTWRQAKLDAANARTLRDRARDAYVAFLRMGEGSGGTTEEAREANRKELQEELRRREDALRAAILWEETTKQRARMAAEDLAKVTAQINEKAQRVADLDKDRGLLVQDAERLIRDLRTHGAEAGTSTTDNAPTTGAQPPGPTDDAGDDVPEEIRQLLEEYGDDLEELGVELEELQLVGPRTD